jgi:hypothetical protein
MRMVRPTDSDRPPRLDYQAAKDARNRFGLTVPARIGAGLCALIFPVWGIYEAYVIGRGEFRARNLLEPSILLCFLASGVFLFAAFGVFGKYRAVDTCSGVLTRDTR